MKRHTMNKVGMAITLRDVDKDNWRLITRLKVAEAQQNYVAPNWHSILLAQFEGPGTLHPRSIYAADAPVGFVLYGHLPDDPRIWIIRLMIDIEQQNKGYGRAAMSLILEEMRDKYHAADIYISFVPENAVARRLYESFGFVDTGTIEDGECVYRLSSDMQQG